MYKNLLNNLKIRSKLALFLIVPVLTLLFFSFSSINFKYQELTTTRDAYNIILASSTIADLLFEIQNERGLSAGFVGGKGKLNKEPLTIQRQKTNEQVKITKLVLNSLDPHHSLNPDHELVHHQNRWGSHEILDRILFKLETIASIRSEVDALNGSKFFDAYSEINAAALNIESYLHQLIQNFDLANQNGSYVTLLWLQERASQERSLLNGIFTSKRLTAERFKAFSTYSAEQETLIANFFTDATQKNQALFQGKMKHPVMAEVEAFHTAVANKAIKNNLLNSLRILIGYGGLIHDFKNYVLRGQSQYTERFEELYDHTTQIISTYRDLPGMSQKEFNALNSITSTFEQYKELLITTKALIAEGRTINEIDISVKVDDQPALNAIQYLHQTITELDTSRWWDKASIRMQLIKEMSDTVRDDLIIKTKNIEIAAKRSFYIYILLTLGSLLASALLGYLLIRRLGGGIINISKHMTSMQKNEALESTLEVSGMDEIGEVSRAFNNLIAARFEAEESLRISQQRLILHREQSPVGIVEWTPDFKVAAWNPAIERIFGYSKEEVMGKGFLDLIVPEKTIPAVDKIWEALLANKGGKHSINENITKAGDTILCEWHNTPLINDEGNVIGVSAIVENITEKQKQEERERQMQKMDAIGKLTGGIAHDFNNMLGVILGYSEILKISLDGENPKLLKYCDQILKAGDRAKKLTSNLLQFSSTAPSSEETIDINALLSNMKHMMETTLTHRIKLIFELEEYLWSICLDKGQLEDAILNMGINAMHAMPDGGTLTMNTSTSHLTKEKAAKLDITTGDYVVLSIADTGSGMPVEVQKKIFDPFFTTKGTEGTGLGLSQVYGFVQQAGGAIEVSSEIGQGTRLNLYFPRCDENNVTKTDAETAGPIELTQSNGTILVVDDEEALLILNEDILTNAGYNVLLANDAEQALEILKNNSVGLMLSDVIMPEVNGYQLAAKVEKLYPEVKVQMVSGYSEGHNKSMANNKLYKQRLSKPVEEDVLLRKVAEILDAAE